MSWDLTFSSKSLAGAYDLCVLPKNIDPDKGLIPKGRAKGAIKFEDVRFSYPHKGVETLKGVNLEISPGQTLVSSNALAPTMIFREFTNIISGTFALVTGNDRENRYVGNSIRLLVCVASKC